METCIVSLCRYIPSRKKLNVGHQVVKSVNIHLVVVDTIPPHPSVIRWVITVIMEMPYHINTQITVHLCSRVRNRINRVLKIDIKNVFSNKKNVLY